MGLESQIHEHLKQNKMPGEGTDLGTTPIIPITEERKVLATLLVHDGTLEDPSNYSEIDILELLEQGFNLGDTLVPQSITRFRTYSGPIIEIEFRNAQDSTSRYYFRRMGTYKRNEAKENLTYPFTYIARVTTQDPPPNFKYDNASYFFEEEKPDDYVFTSNSLDNNQRFDENTGKVYTTDIIPIKTRKDLNSNE